VFGAAESSFPLASLLLVPAAAFEALVSEEVGLVADSSIGPAVPRLQPARDMAMAANVISANEPLDAKLRNEVLVNRGVDGERRRAAINCQRLQISIKCRCAMGRILGRCGVDATSWLRFNSG